MKLIKFFIYIFRFLLLFIIPLFSFTLGLIPSMIILKFSITILNLNSYTHLIFLLLISTPCLLFISSAECSLVSSLYRIRRCLRETISSRICIGSDSALPITLMRLPSGRYSPFCSPDITIIEAMFIPSDTRAVFCVSKKKQLP